MLYDWSMDSNHSTEISGSKTDVVCARVGGANTTPLLSSAVHFAKQKTSSYFLLLQNMNSRKKYGRREAPSVLHSPHKILILQGFATLRVAPRLPIQNYD